MELKHNPAEDELEQPLTVCLSRSSTIASLRAPTTSTQAYAIPTHDARFRQLQMTHAPYAYFGSVVCGSGRTGPTSAKALRGNPSTLEADRPPVHAAHVWRPRQGGSGQPRALYVCSNLPAAIRRLVLRMEVNHAYGTTLPVHSI